MRSRNTHRSWLEENYMISLNVCVASYQLHISCHTNDLFANTTYWTKLHNKHPEWCTPEIPKIAHRKFFPLTIWLIVLLRNLRYIDKVILKWCYYVLIFFIFYCVNVCKYEIKTLQFYTCLQKCTNLNWKEITSKNILNTYDNRY